MITKRGFLLRGSCFCENYSYECSFLTVLKVMVWSFACYTAIFHRLFHNVLLRINVPLADKMFTLHINNISICSYTVRKDVTLFV